MLKRIFFVLLLLLCVDAKASHIVGGEIYYDTLGNGQYKITIELFRDCQNSATQFDNPIEYSIFYADGTLFGTFSILLPTPQILPIVYDDPCVTPPNDICIERAIYIDTVTLGFNPTGFYISYQRCCWANNIQNMVDPENNGITLTTAIPGNNLVNFPNNSARFNDYPPLVLCANNSLNFDHSAFDLDGDSLVYMLCSPLLGGSIANVVPNPESPAPYVPISWETSYSSLLPFGPASNVSINAQTGMMVFTPSQIGNFVMGVCVYEYRNGVLINENMRTFSYRVVNCLVEVPIVVDLIGPPNLIEDCGFAGFVISRTDTLSDLTVQVLLSGTAINGLDYNFINDSLVLPQGVFTDTIGFTPFFDGLTEGNEVVVLNIIIPNPCDGTFDTLSTTVNIIDYLPLEIVTEDSINVCVESGDIGLLWSTVTNGALPYTYTWTPDYSFPNNDTIFVDPANLSPNLNLFTLNVLDQCNKTIQSTQIEVYNQCPLTVPNFFSPNNDDINEFFIISNLDSYDRVALSVLNRWGNLIYENPNYQNDWSGTTTNNQKVTEGVYFYTVEANSEKYTYDDQEKTQFVLHGYFHIVN